MKDLWSNDNLILAFNRLVTNPESTYKNYFRNVYIAYGLALRENIALLRRKKTGYIPANPVRAYLPKANGLSRMYTLLSIEDQIVYQSLGNIIAEQVFNDRAVKKRYKKSVFGNLYTGSNSQFFYQPWQDSYSAFTSAVRGAYSVGYEYIASFDLTACYDSINHKLISTTLTNKFKVDYSVVNDLIRLLKKWMSCGVELSTGIPQGPLTSGIISEAVLSEYDDEIEQLQKTYDFKYYRYVDDIRILAKDEATVKWILFILDKKSKELGLFPQSSKITTHKIDDIEKEINSISKPLFDDDTENSIERGELAAANIRKLLKNDTANTTSIKRYFHYVNQNAKTNAIAIMALERFPNLIHSFAYYVKRYPRKIPEKLSNYIYECCQDKTRQFASGILLESIIGNLRKQDEQRFLELAKTIVEEDKKKHHIYDSRFQLQLLLLILCYDEKRNKKYISYVKKCDWWVKSNLLYRAADLQVYDRLGTAFIRSCCMSDQADISLPVAYNILIGEDASSLPAKRVDIAPIAQAMLKNGGIIKRKRITNTQINRYIAIVTNTASQGYQWKKKLGREHDEIERKLFVAVGYWQTDLTAFVNIWDTIDDIILSLIAKDHPNELGGYTLGSIGSAINNKKMKANIPKFHNMCMEIHALRLSSQLSHYVQKSSQKYTGPVNQKQRRRIRKLIKEGYDEIQKFW